MVTKSENPTRFFLSETFANDGDAYGIRYAIIEITKAMKNQIKFAKTVLATRKRLLKSGISDLYSLTFGVGNSFFFDDYASDETGIEEIEDLNNTNGGVFVNTSNEELEKALEKGDTNIDTFVMRVFNDTVYFSCSLKHGNATFETQGLNINYLLGE